MFIIIIVVSKQMKTINFSLSSPKYSNEGWIVRVSSGRHRQVIQQASHRRKRKRDRSSIQTTDSLLPTINFRNDVLNTKVTHIIIYKPYVHTHIVQNFGWRKHRSMFLYILPPPKVSLGKVKGTPGIFAGLVLSRVHNYL